MAKSKQEKEALVAQYQQWLDQSQAIVLVEYTGVTMKNLDAIRAKAREAGGEFHIVKNTLVKLALEKSGLTIPENALEKSTAIGFAFNDPASFVKALQEATKGLEAIKVKVGFMGLEMLSAAQVKALADLPPLPVVQAQLLGVLQAPASKLVRLLAEPGRQVASVLKAYSDKTAPAAA
ncbi:MAG: 50S ribosomal protein L10 [Anaerolineales bacterium]|nr:50S ribosomal protein L10 [Anaerolineales bacterium]